MLHGGDAPALGKRLCDPDPVGIVGAANLDGDTELPRRQPRIETAFGQQHRIAGEKGIDRSHRGQLRVDRQRKPFAGLEARLMQRRQPLHHRQIDDRALGPGHDRIGGPVLERSLQLAPADTSRQSKIDTVRRSGFSRNEVGNGRRDGQGGADFHLLVAGDLHVEGGERCLERPGDLEAHGERIGVQAIRRGYRDLVGQLAGRSGAEPLGEHPLRVGSLERRSVRLHRMDGPT